MATILEQKKERLQRYLEAEAAVLSNQSYTLNGRSVTRANLAHIKNGISELEADIRRLENRHRRMKRIVPVDR